MFFASVSLLRQFEHRKRSRISGTSPLTSRKSSRPPSSSVRTASVDWALSHVVVQRATLKTDARYLAQRLGLILEKYAVDCGDFIAGNEQLKQTGRRKNPLSAARVHPVAPSAQ